MGYDYRRIMKHALIFDLDGTLWDATVPVAEAWREVGQKYFGPSYSLSVEKTKSLMGKTMSEIKDALTPEGTPSDLKETFGAECFDYEREYLKDHPGKLFPEELQTLEALRERYDLYIVSNCQSGYIETFLPLVPEGLFLGHRCWSDTKKEKQFTIRLLMEAYGIEIAAYVGDTEKDELAAKAAGIPFIHAAFGFGRSIDPDATAESFQDLQNAAASVI